MPHPLLTPALQTCSPWIVWSMMMHAWFSQLGMPFDVTPVQKK